MNCFKRLSELFLRREGYIYLMKPSKKRAASHKNIFFHILFDSKTYLIQFKRPQLKT